MMNHSLYLVFGATLLVAGGCQSAGPALSPTDIRAHHAMSQRFLEHVHAADWAGMSAMYEEDAVVTASRGRVIWLTFTGVTG